LGIKRIAAVCKNKQIPSVRYDVKVFRGELIAAALPWKEARKLFLSLREKNPASKYCIVVAK